MNSAWEGMWRRCGRTAAGLRYVDVLLDKTSTTTTYSFSGSGHGGHVVMVTWTQELEISGAVAST
jgi:hypothetical protein